MYKLEKDGGLTLRPGTRNGVYEWKARPDMDFGLGIYLRFFNLRDFNALVNHDFNQKPQLNEQIYHAMTLNNRWSPSWDEFKKAYSDLFEFVGEFHPCPGQQSLETVMEEIETEQEPSDIEKNEPGSVYGDTPNNVKQQPISFADLFNKSAQPFEIDGKLYKPHLELIDVNSDQN